MLSLLYIIQIFIIIALVLVILLQKSGNNGLAGLSGGGGGVISSRSASAFFTKATVILVAAFLLNSLILAKLQTKEALNSQSLIENIGSITEPSILIEEEKEASSQAPSSPDLDENGDVELNVPLAE